MATASPLQRTGYRIDSIDLLRGLIMIIMALDHVRDFFHSQAFIGSTTNMQTTTPILFFTRWITHFCAPVFVFLAGASIFFQSRRKTKKELSIFLLKRGLWLILLEVVVMSFAYSFDPQLRAILLLTIWSIAVSMIITGLMIWLPMSIILTAGLIIVLGHNALNYYEAKNPDTGIFYSLMHQVRFINLGNNYQLFALYPFLSWTGLMLIGYCFGKFFTDKEGGERKKRLIITGIAVTALFIILRAINIYGDPSKWSPQKNGVFTVLSFLNPTKNPPSLLFTTMTIGPAILFLAFAGNIKNRLTKIITVYGRVPFFYYVIHFYLIHFAVMIIFFIKGHSVTTDLPTQPSLIPNFIIPGEGYSLGVVYVIWIILVIIMYPLCKWYGDYKQKHKKWWLSYL